MALFVIGGENIGGKEEREKGRVEEEDRGRHESRPRFFPIKANAISTLLNGIAVIHRSGGNSVVVMPSAQITRRILRHK